MSEPTKRLIYSDQALRDTDEIFDYLKAEAGAATAFSFVQGLEQHIRRLAVLGQSGASRNALYPGLRLSVYRRRCVYFIVDDEKYTVLRIVHGSRDQLALSFDAGERTAQQ